MDDSPALAELIEVIRDQIGMSPLDFGTAMAVLNRISPGVRGRMDPIVGHAREAVAAAPGKGPRHEALARYALARVLIALEAEGSRAAFGHGATDDQARPPSST